MKRTTRRLALDAMLSAMFVVLSLISISLPNMKITLDALPVLVASLLFGPLDGLSVGLIGSFLNQLLTYGLSPTTLLWILPAGLRGLLVGLYAKRHQFETINLNVAGNVEAFLKERFGDYMKIPDISRIRYEQHALEWDVEKPFTPRKAGTFADEKNMF